MQKIRSLVFLVMCVVLIAASACSSTSSSGKSSPTPTPIPPPPIPEKPTYTVKRGTVVDQLSFTGRVSPVIEEELFFRESGRVKKVYVERNDIVEEGQLLAELENDDLLKQLAQTQLELETAELNLKEAQAQQEYAIQRAAISLEMKKLQLQRLEESLKTQKLDTLIAKIELESAKKGPSPEDIAIAQHRLEKAKNALWGVQIDRDSTCRQEGPACDAKQAAVQRAEEDLRIEELNLQKTLAGPTEEELQKLQANYEKALARQKQIELDIEVQKQQITLAEMELEKLKTDIDPQLVKAVERNKLAVERLQAQVEATRITSPIAGKVTSVSAYEGRSVNAYKVVFVVSDESQLEITAEPMSNQLQRLAEGMEAEIVLSAYPGKVLKGKIYQLPYPYGSGGGATVEEADKLVHIEFDPEDLALEPGDLVKVNVTLEKKEDALWLPPAAIRTFAGRTFVVVEENGVQRRVDVTIGIESTERVEILDGLEEGQLVVGQ